MVTPILLPKQGNSVESCLILEWKKKEGEVVKNGDIICEIETDKAVFEIESPSNGILLKTFFEEGDDVPVLTNIAVVGDNGESYDEYIPNLDNTGIDENKEDDQVDTEKSVSKIDSADQNILIEEEVPAGKKSISPRAIKLADKYKINIKNIIGTGPGNRIIERDILEANKSREPLSIAARDLVNDNDLLPETGSGIGNRITTKDLKNKSDSQRIVTESEAVKTVPLKGVRKLIAERMLSSLQNSAQLTLNSSADVTALLTLRKKFKNSKIYNEFKSITINDLVQYTVIKTLPQHKELNSLLLGDKIEYHDKIHLGFAVDTPRGLLVPVIKNAQELNLLQLSSEAKRLAEASISGKIDADELNGATFTITNLGNFGIESFTPVLNIPQTGILGINTINLKPIDKGKGVEFIPHISFSLTIDHRVIDGAVAARFLQNLGNIVSEIDLVISMTATE